MKLRRRLTFLVLALASCVPAVADLGKTQTPPMTDSASPLQVPAPINTPHGIPTALGVVTQDEALELYEERVGLFENSLEFKIRVLDVSHWTQDDMSLYVMQMEGTITNISNRPVVIPRYLRSGFAIDPEVFWYFYHDGKRLDFNDCCVDGWLNIDENTFTLLQPGEFQRYIWELSVPGTMQNADGQDVSLSQNPIEIAATYANHRVGFSHKEEDGSVLGKLVTTTDEHGELVFYEVDMNAWVGEVQSDSILYVFP